VFEGFAYMGRKNPAWIEAIFLGGGAGVDVYNVITSFKFGDDRLRSLELAAGESSSFPINFDGRPYNTLTLPCDRTISTPRHDIIVYRSLHAA